MGWLDILVIYLKIINVLGFLAAMYDKRAARGGTRRVPEKVFFLFALIGGGAGELLAFYVFKHKTRHTKLLATVWIPTIIWIAALFYFIK